MTLSMKYCACFIKQEYCLSTWIMFSKFWRQFYIWSNLYDCDKIIIKSVQFFQLSYVVQFLYTKTITLVYLTLVSRKGDIKSDKSNTTSQNQEIFANLSHVTPNRWQDLGKKHKQFKATVLTHHLQILQVFNICPVICIKYCHQLDTLVAEAYTHPDIFIFISFHFIFKDFLGTSLLI